LAFKADSKNTMSHLTGPEVHINTSNIVIHIKICE